MRDVIERYLSVATEDEMLAQRGQRLNVLIAVLSFANVLTLLNDIIMGKVRPGFLSLELLAFALFGVLYWFTRRGRRWPPYLLLVFLILLNSSIFHSYSRDVAIIAMAVSVSIAPLIAPPWLCLPVAAGEALMLYELSWFHGFPLPDGMVIITLGVLGAFSWLASWSLERALGEAYRSAKALAETNRSLEQEIVERERIGRALRQSEQRFRSVVQSAQDAIVISSSEGIIGAWNDAARAMFGYDAKEVLGGPITLLMPERHRDEYREEIGRLRSVDLPSSIGDTVEMHGLRKGGQEFPAEVSFATWNEGHSMMFSAIVRDITERKQAEAALEAERASLARRVAERTAELSAVNSDLAQALRARDEFLAAMSHELRTPLNAVLGLAEALQEGVYGPLNQRQLQSLRNIGKSGRHLLLLITDVLDVVQIGAGRLALQMGPVPVEPVCESSLEMVKSAAREKRLRVISTYDSAVDTVQADGRRLKQILINLLNNGVKFTPEGGTVGLEVEGDAEQEVVRFTVWDTGVGMSKEDLGRLFQPFVQLDSGLARSYGGTGLGLALVHQLVDLHGGGVSVESKVGQGSRFTVSLPWRPGQEAGVAEVASSQAAEQRPEPAMVVREPSAVVLLAEDNEANLSSLRDYLLSKGYQVVVARNGEEAIARAREKRPDLILMDIQMPVMDGLEATRRIRADADLGRVPIIALTALAMRGDREQCLAAGVDEYLSKPVSFRGLVELIEAQVRLGQKGGVM